MINIIKKLSHLQEKKELSEQQKALLVTDGAVTTLLEAFTGSKINVVAKNQKVIKVNEKLAKELKIKNGEDVNERMVFLVDSNTHKPLVYAESYTPFSRLSNEFKEDILRKDIPIGKILKKHKIESRREIKDIDLKNNQELSKLLGLERDTHFLWRDYLIIHKNLPFMKIEEYVLLD